MTNQLNSTPHWHIKILYVFLCAILCGLGWGMNPAQAYDTKTPTKYDVERERKKLENVGIDHDKLGEEIDLNLNFKNEYGQDVQLKDAFLGDKPVLLSVIYYKCPNLCNFHMNGVVAALDKVKLEANKDYRWVTVSMDVTETPQMALDKKGTYIEQEQKKDEANQQNIKEGWQFLTGTEENVKELTQQLGFSFRWDEESQQFAHTAAIYTVTPEGKISQIIPGIEFMPQTIQLSLVEAAQGKIGTFMDRVSLFCFQFDPKKNQYTVYAYNFMRAGAVLTLILMLVFLGPTIYQSLKKDRIKES